jgi:hypothetical protein
MSSDGGVPVDYSSFLSLSNLNRVSLGFDRLSNSNYINGHLKKFSYYSGPLSEDNLRALTGNKRAVTRFTIDDIVTSGLVLNLDAGNPTSYPGSGTTWTDLSGNGNTGTLTNGPTYSSSNGGSLSFDGVDDYINIGSQSLVGSGTSPFSVELWFYNTKNWTSGQYTMFFRVKQDTEFFTVLYNSSGTLNIWGVFRGSTQWGIPVTQSDYVNRWICMSIVYNGENKSSASSYLTYVNGVVLPFGTNNFGGAGGGGSNCNIIGADGDSGCNVSVGFHGGNISSYKVYNRALTAAEISQNFNALRNRFDI